MDKTRKILILSSFVLVFVFFASLAVGRYWVPFADTLGILGSGLFPVTPTWDKLAEAVVLNLRLPRTVAALIVGSALALSGSCYQSIFKNPMVSPDLLGVSAGASVGAAIAILLDFGSVMIQVAAFFSGLGAVLLTVSIPRLIRNESTTVLVLSGVVISAFMASCLSLLKYVADVDTKLAEITYWTMGSFAMVNFETMLPVLPSIILPVIVILLMRFRLNVLSLGDNEARMLGVNLRLTRGLFVLLSTVITASCVCLSGTIGWVGLVIPHTARMVTGADNKKMLFVALVFGAIFMLCIDILCRTITAAELRLGILTGIIGAPFFIVILIKQQSQIS